MNISLFAGQNSFLYVCINNFQIEKSALSSNNFRITANALTVAGPTPKMINPTKEKSNQRILIYASLTIQLNSVHIPSK